MKKITRSFTALLILMSFQFCTVKSDGKWKSEKTNLELNFNDTWELIIPNIDIETQTLVGIKDNSDNSSFTVKITDDLPKDQVPDEYYFTAIREQMLMENPKNELVAEDTVELKGVEYHRMIFYMTTKFGEMTHTIYTHRNGEKVNGIQFTYPKSLVKSPTEIVPLKIEKLLK